MAEAHKSMNTVLFVINSPRCEIFQKGAFIRGEIFSAKISQEMRILMQETEWSKHKYWFLIVLEEV